MIPYGKNSPKYTERNRQNNPQVTLRVTLKTHSQFGVNSDKSEYSLIKLSITLKYRETLKITLDFSVIILNLSVYS